MHINIMVEHWFKHIYGIGNNNPIQVDEVNHNREQDTKSIILNL